MVAVFTTPGGAAGGSLPWWELTTARGGAAALTNHFDIALPVSLPVPRSGSCTLIHTHTHTKSLPNALAH